MAAITTQYGHTTFKLVATHRALQDDISSMQLLPLEVMQLRLAASSNPQNYNELQNSNEHFSRFMLFFCP